MDFGAKICMHSSMNIEKKCKLFEKEEEDEKIMCNMVHALYDFYGLKNAFGW